MKWKNLSLTLSLIAAGLGMVGLSGWVFGIDALTRLHPAWVTMKANTAICLFLAGVAIALRRDESAGGWQKAVAQTCAAIIILVGVLTLTEILSGMDMGIDQALFHETAEQAGRSFPGQMGLATALNFVLLGAGVFLLDVRPRRDWEPAQLCALGIVVVTFLIFLASFYDVEMAYPLSFYLSIALHTVIAFFLLAPALLLARPERGMMRIFLADDIAGDIARRMLPAALILPGLLGWASVSGRDSGLYGGGVGSAMLATLLTAIFTALVWWMARALAASDLHRRTDAEAARHRLAAIVDSSDDSIVSKDLNGIVTSWNAGAERLLGYSAAEMIGQTLERTIPPERRGEEEAILRRLCAGERIEHYKTVRIAADGRRLDVSLTASPMRDATGTIIGASKIVRDITGQKQAEAALEQARDEAEAANRAKDDFLAVLSHELRTPLTPALAAATDLEASPPADRQELRASLAIIRRNIELEARLVDDLLDVTRIGHGKLRIASAPVDLHASLRDALLSSEPIFRKKGISISSELGARDHFVKGDAARLAQVFSNLLANAAKFTPDGGRVSVRTADLGSCIQAEVRDSGIGIDAALLPHIFDPFRQGSPVANRRFGGLGLGLSVARGLVEAHGGTIAAQSEGEGSGAAFTVTLPTDAARAEASLPDAHPAASGPARALRVLLVEDHEDTRIILDRLMVRWGHEVVLASCVAEARELLAGESFDLVLSDLGLPDGTGLDVVAALRERSHTPAVAMSGYGMAADIERTQAAGFDAHLVKPIAAEALRELLAKVAANGAPGRT